MTLSAERVLDLWERGAAQPPVLAAVTVLGAATGMAPGDAAQLPVGERDVRLADLHRVLRGNTVEGMADCPACAERLETVLNLDEVFVAPASDTARACGVGAYRAEFRLPSSADLLAVSDREALLRRCITKAWKGRKTISADAAPDALLDAVEEAMAEADPAGDIRLALTCPACAHQWVVVFDIGRFVWMEIDALARRIAGEVHLLAAAYGWREADILAMSAARRQLYIRQAYG